ncbi:MAG: hypothetical protein ABI775_06565, partial [Pseudonocardiales bacterium]
MQANAAGRPARAARVLRRALDLMVAEAGTEPAIVTLRIRLLIALASSEFELSGLDRGLAVLDSAATEAADHRAKSLASVLASQRGLLHLRAGNHAQALANLDEAIRRVADAPELDRLKILLNRGALNLDGGALRSARVDLLRCLELARRSREPQAEFEFKATHNLGYLEFLAGDLPLSLHLIDEANRLSVDVSRGILLLDRARVLAETGLIREADESLAEASVILRRDRLAQDLAETELERARCALISGDVPAARRFAGRARDRFRRRTNERWRRSAELVLLQADLAAGRPGSRLIEPALRLRDELDHEGLRLLARAAGLIAAEAHLAIGDVAAAATVVGALGPASRRDPITGRLHSRFVRARLDVARGELRAAARHVRAGLSELADYQASFGSIDLQTASAVHGRRLAELSLTLALRSHRAANVLAAAERARAVSTRLPVVRPPTDPQSAELLAELRRTVESVRGAMQDATALAPLLRRRRELERAITARRWTLAGTGEARRSARLDEIRAGVATADSTMVVFVEAGGAMHAVVIRAGRLRLQELGSSTVITEQVRRARADLDVLARPRLAGGLSAAVRGSFERSVVGLDRSLLGPLELDGQRLIIVSTGILGQLPWGTLPSLRGVPVVVAPSATAWLAAMHVPARRRTRRVFAVAGPDLVRANHEVAGVAAAWGTATTHT